MKIANLKQLTRNENKDSNCNSNVVRHIKSSFYIITVYAYHVNHPLGGLRSIPIALTNSASCRVESQSDRTLHILFQIKLYNCKYLLSIVGIWRSFGEIHQGSWYMPDYRMPSQFRFRKIMILIFQSDQTAYIQIFMPFGTGRNFCNYLPSIRSHNSQTGRKWGKWLKHFTMGPARNFIN